MIPAGAVAHQYADPLTSGGHYDLSVVADHWPGVDEGGDVPLTDADAITIWGYENPKAGDTHDMHQAVKNAEANSAAAVSALAALKTQLTALQQSVSGVDADVKTTAASVIAAIAAGVQVTLTGDQVSEIESRLASALPGYTVNITPAAPPSA